MTKIMGVYFAWIGVMVGAGFAGDLTGSPALLWLARTLGLAMPFMIVGVFIALICHALFGKSHDD